MYKPRSKLVTSNPIGYLFNREYSDSPYTIKQALSSRLNTAKSLHTKNLLAHFGCVNAIEFSNGGELLASGMFKLYYIKNYELHIYFFDLKSHFFTGYN